MKKPAKKATVLPVREEADENRGDYETEKLSAIVGNALRKLRIDFPEQIAVAIDCGHGQQPADEMKHRINLR